MLSHTHHYGSSFKLLGVLFDVQLTMGEAVAECASEAHWRLSAILRTRRFFSLVDLILQYKSQVLSYLEYRTCAVSHAADIHLYHMDSVQRRFLTNVGLSIVEALRIHNLAPLSCRRDISNLGIIYRAITKRGPKKLWKFFKLDITARRTSPRWNIHRYQISDVYRNLHRDYINRSTFGYIHIFNLLPDAVFIMEGETLPISLKDFQRNLSNLLKMASLNVDNWEELYSSRMPFVSHVLNDFRNVDVIPSLR